MPIEDDFTRTVPGQVLVDVTPTAWARAASM